MFAPGEWSKDILIKIIDDDISEPDVSFSVALTAASIDGGAEVSNTSECLNVSLIRFDSILGAAVKMFSYCLVAEDCLEVPATKDQLLTSFLPASSPAAPSGSHYPQYRYGHHR